MAEPRETVWDDVLAHLRNETPDLCRNWFESLEVRGLDSMLATVVAQTDAHRDYLESRCADAFDHALRRTTGTLITARFVCQSGQQNCQQKVQQSGQHPAPSHNTPHFDRPLDAVARDAINPPEPFQAPAGSRGRRSDGAGPIKHPSREELGNGYRHGTLPLSPDYAFKHFVIGPGNRIAHAAALAVADNPGRAYNPLFIHGDVGLGKTHLLQAVCLQLVEHRPGYRIFYTSCEHFTQRFIAAVQAGKMKEFHSQFRDVDALVLDDIHFLTRRERTQEEFFHTFNALYQADKQLILSSDAPPDEIPDLEARLVSRFKWGLVTSVSPPTYETRLEIIKEKAKLRGLRLDDKAAELIASREQDNIRELEGDLTKLQLHAAIAGNDDVELELVRTALGDVESRQEQRISLEQIMDTVCDYFGISRADIRSRKRARSIALPRQHAMFLAKKLTDHALVEIGRFFGGRDHTTALYGIRKIHAAVAGDPEAKATVQRLAARLGRTLPPEPAQAEASQPLKATPEATPEARPEAGRDAGIEPHIDADSAADPLAQKPSAADPADR
ncbi:MAG: chromosomal replication initiator protein DnaA [Planctomycetota bacterium]